MTYSDKGMFESVNKTGNKGRMNHMLVWEYCCFLLAASHDLVSPCPVVLAGNHRGHFLTQRTKILAVKTDLWRSVTELNPALSEKGTENTSESMLKRDSSKGSQITPQKIWIMPNNNNDNDSLANYTPLMTRENGFTPAGNKNRTFI